MNRGDPGIAVRVENDAFTKPMGFVEAAGQHAKAMGAGPGFGQIRVNSITAQLNADTATGALGQKAMERVMAVGVVMVEHEIGT